MTSAILAFWLYLVLTGLCALVTLWRLMPRAAPPKPDIAKHIAALATMTPTGPDAESIKTIGEAMSDVLKGFTDLGTSLDTMGPTALLGVFTLIFAMLTLASAWIGRN